MSTELVKLAAYACLNADMREYIQRLLAERYEVETVADGQAALERVRADPPDLVLVDVMMPRLDGVSLLHQLRADERTRTLPLIMRSARAGEEARVEGLTAGADTEVHAFFPTWSQVCEQEPTL
jgi:DNA-binding response OmpR family regulator